ncbi:MAG: hypothetical protein ABI068_02030 [Ktedonobacterales bacterium]
MQPMQNPQSKSAPVSSQAAITDLYDVQRRTFLFQYPIWLVIGLAITGVIAFALSGFLGYNNTGADGIFVHPWELYLWFCALLVVLQVSIFRNQALRGRLIATLIITLLSIIVVYIYGGFPGGFIRHLIEQFLPTLATSPLTYTVVNFGIIAIFWVDTVRRWIRRLRNLPLNPVIDLTTGRVIDGPVDPSTLPSMQELVSGDLIAGAVLTALLWIFFQPGVITLFIHTNPMLTACDVSLPTTSGCGASLSFLDQVQALIYLPLGLIILALAATLGGFAGVGGVNDTDQSGQEVQDTQNAAKSGAASGAASGVAETVLDALRSALDRRLRLLLTSLARSLRNIAWPALIFIAIYGIFQLSSFIQMYLHLTNKLQLMAILYVLAALGWGLLSVLGVVVSSALTIFRWRVVDNTLRFLGLVGLIVLLTVWIFSLALWGFNQLLFLTSATTRAPFSPPASATYISFAALVIFGVYLFAQRFRSPKVATSPAKTPANGKNAERSSVPVGAPVTTSSRADNAEANANGVTPTEDPAPAWPAPPAFGTPGDTTQPLNH